MKNKLDHWINYIKDFCLKYERSFPGNFIGIPRNYKGVAVRKAQALGIIEKTGEVNMLGQPFYRRGEKLLTGRI